MIDIQKEAVLGLVLIGVGIGWATAILYVVVNI